MVQDLTHYFDWMAFQHLFLVQNIRSSVLQIVYLQTIFVQHSFLMDSDWLRLARLLLSL